MRYKITNDVKHDFNKKLSYRRETRAMLCVSLNVGLLLYE